MSKRKAGENAPSKEMEVDGDDGSGDDEEILNVDFEWFDLQPDIDFEGLKKTLLRQLFDVDNQLFDLSELTNMILDQKSVGSTVKCDGIESDPFAFLTVLNLQHHREKPVIQQLRKYLLGRVAGKESMQQLPRLLDPNSTAQIGLILTERLINMPHQVVPPLYDMVLAEMKEANAEEELYQFSHYLIISKTYTEVVSNLDEEDGRPQKKKRGTNNGGLETFYFHPEDEILQKHALESCDYQYVKELEEGGSDARRTFQELGIRPQGHLALIEAGKFEGALKAMGEYLGS